VYSGVKANMSKKSGSLGTVSQLRPPNKIKSKPPKVQTGHCQGEGHTAERLVTVPGVRGLSWSWRPGGGGNMEFSALTYVKARKEKNSTGEYLGGLGGTGRNFSVRWGGGGEGDDV